jgi:hypothetical protein
VRKAITLTLFLVLLPYIAAIVVAMLNPWALVGIPAMAAATPVTFPAVQRLVRFMLTGEMGSPETVLRRSLLPNELAR